MATWYLGTCAWWGSRDLIFCFGTFAWWGSLYYHRFPAASPLGLDPLPLRASIVVGAHNGAIDVRPHAVCGLADSVRACRCSC